MNFTVDDADPSFGYSNDWAVQADSDPDRAEFFQSTYHVATADGASMSFQFSGSAFALYGSKGPGHAKYQVQFDNTVINLDAFADTTAFRQELFAHTFSASGVHTVKLIAVLAGDGIKGRWLDVDYITFSAGNASTTTSGGTATSLPPWETESSSLSNGFDSPATVFPAGSTSVSAPASGSSSSPSKLPTILAILFGVLIAIALLIGALWLVLRRVHDRRRARERAFRYGQSSVNPASSASAMGTGYYTSSAASAKSGGGLSGPGSGTGSGSRGGLLHSLFSAFSSAPRHGHGHGHGHAPSMSVREQPGRTYTPVASLSSHVLEMGSMSLDVRERERELQRDREREREREDAGTPNTARALLSASPTAWGGMRGKRSRGDADSLRTDFLQV